MDFSPQDFLDLSQCELNEIFDGVKYAWEVLPKIAGFLENQKTEFRIEGEIMAGAHILGSVHLGKGSVIEPGAVIKGPCWIGQSVHVRAGCYIRENVIIGEKSVVGNSCEFKNCILFKKCEVPHFNYVGDSVLGHKAHLGAGVILSNVRLMRDEILVKDEQRVIATGLRKFGAIIGDYAEVGCNSVLNPGALIGRRSLIYPCINWKGYLPPDSIVKNESRYTLSIRKN